MSRILVQNATAENFKIEVFSSEPADGSSGDHQDGRLVKFGKNVYIWNDSTGAWIKFPNLENFQSLETRLSSQESDRAAADGSLQTIDLSLQTRIANSAEASRSVAISTEASSMASADTSLTSRLGTAETARSTAVSSEASSMASADTSLTTKISTAEDARSADVSSEASRALSAQTSVQLRTSQEESNEASAETSLNTRVSTQSSARVVAANSVATVLGTATSNRSSGDSSLQTLIETEEARVNAMLNAAAADKDTFVEVVSFINATDVTSDGELSTEFSTLTSSVASANTARGAADTSLTTRLSTEESVRLVKDTSLETRLSLEESNEASAEVSLDARTSAASSARLSADTSRASNISDAASNRGSADTSLTTRISTEESARLSAVTSMNSRASSMESTNVSAAASLNTKVSVATSARSSAALSAKASVSVALSSEASSVAVADASLTTRISSEESARASADTSLSTELSSQASARTSADLSLTTRLSTEESVETSAEASHNVRASSEISARTSADLSFNVKYSGEFSTERSRVDAILDSADADKNTFVEVVSFLTAVDTASDDVLASYVVSIDADISSEASTQASADASLTTRLSTEESAETAALSVQQSTSESAEASVQAKISTLESHEDKRHVRIDFTNETSITIANSDLPAGFTAGNGMVQVFQDMGSSTYRHLVAPATVNPSTGAMTFDLGTSAKSGFAVFYSFAGDETTVTEQVSVPTPTAIAIDASKITITYSGLSAATAYYISGWRQTEFQYYRTGYNFLQTDRIDNTEITFNGAFTQVEYDLQYTPRTDLDDATYQNVTVTLKNLGYEGSDAITFRYDDSYNVSLLNVPSVTTPSATFALVPTGGTGQTYTSGSSVLLHFVYNDAAIAVDFITNTLAQPSAWKFYARKNSTSTTYKSSDLTFATQSSPFVTTDYGGYQSYLTDSGTHKGYKVKLPVNGNAGEATYPTMNANWYEFQVVYNGSDKSTYPIVETFRKSGSSWAYNASIADFSTVYSEGDGIT